MSEVNSTTLNQLMEMYHQSRKKGEQVSLSMEAKDGKDFIVFSIGIPAGSPARNQQRWPSWPGFKRRKTPSQMRRDQRRKEDYLAKKKVSLDVKVEKVDEATLSETVDEIELNELKEGTQVKENSNLFKIKGEFKNPGFKPWETVEPKKELEILWDALKNENVKN